jgi:regulator of protease activity HflC (stomatin/prohibitin superfamily)
MCFPCCTQVETSEVVAIERCGKLNRFELAGCICVCWPWETMLYKESLRQEVLEVSLHTKTIDNVFVTVAVACNYAVNRNRIYEAYYSLQNRHAQLGAYIKDGIRTSFCTMTLDGVYAAKEEVSLDLKQSIARTFEGYGLDIMSVLVKEITPDSRVMNAMNEINAAKRNKEAAYQRAEGEKVIKVKRAEAEAESMYLSGEGVAKQRKAIMDGLKESIVEFSAHVHGTSAKDVMDLLVLNQYFDALEAIGHNSNVKVVLLPSDQNPTRSGIMEANASNGGMLGGLLKNK